MIRFFSYTRKAECGVFRAVCSPKPISAQNFKFSIWYVQLPCFKILNFFLYVSELKCDMADIMKGRHFFFFQNRPNWGKLKFDISETVFRSRATIRPPWGKSGCDISSKENALGRSWSLSKLCRRRFRCRHFLVNWPVATIKAHFSFQCHPR